MGDLLSFIQKIPGVVVFIIDSKEFCISIQNLRGILNPSDPDVKVEWDKSRICFENINYTLFDNKKYFRSKNYTAKNNRILLVDFGSEKFGILVDKVVEYITFDDMFILNSITFEKSEIKFIKMNLNYQGRTIFFPEYDEIKKDFESLNKNQKTI